ncbi:MAG: DUF488 family protein, N3 subclade [Acidimicrobiales bacterium]
MSKPRIELARVSDEGGVDGDLRILIDRLWPRDLSRDKARFDLWCKDVAPTSSVLPRC